MYEGSTVAFVPQGRRDHDPALDCNDCTCVKIFSGVNFFTTHSKLRKVLFLALSVTFFVCFWLWIKYLWNSWTDLHQIHREDMFGPSLGQVWMSKVKGHQGQKTHCALLSPPPQAATEWNALAANNVIQQQTWPVHRCGEGVISAALIRSMFVEHLCL